MTLERWIVRGVVALALATAVVSTVALDAPESLPAIALDSQAIFSIERMLVLFYGGLLLILPVIRGVLRGELPVELSPRGARYQEIVSSSEEHDSTLEETVERHEQSIREIMTTVAWLRTTRTDRQEDRKTEGDGQ